MTPTAREAAASMPSGVRSLLCTEHGAFHHDVGLDQVESFIADPANLLWLDIDTAITKDLSLLPPAFAFHHLALEDAIHRGQRAKFDQYEHFSFLLFYAIDGESPLEALKLSQIALFIGPNYLVTVHDGPFCEVDESAQRWRQNLQTIDRSIGVLVYSLLDAIVDAYFPIVDQVAERVEDIEETVFRRFDPGALEQVFQLKKSLLSLRRAVAPERDVVNTLVRRDAPVFGAESLLYFQDLYDHIVRVTDSIDIYRDLLSSALDSYLSVASNRLNEVMKTLTSLSIPLMAASFLVGVWGMNFEHMPELGWRYGYPAALSFIAAVSVAIAMYFRRKRWL